MTGRNLEIDVLKEVLKTNLQRPVDVGRREMTKAEPPPQAVRLLLRWPTTAQVASPQRPVLWLACSG